LVIDSSHLFNPGPPNVLINQKKVEELEKLDWWRYFSAKTILGTKMEE